MVGPAQFFSDFASSMRSNKCAVIVGVNVTGGLPPLSSAVSGAENFQKWASSQGIENVLITDKDQAVTVQMINDAITNFVDKKSYDQMIVYYSGHGILKSASDEQWLLSKAPGNVNEAVNVQPSKLLCRRSGIPNIVIISDACRSIPNDPLISGVFGSVIFPNLMPNETNVSVDILYATSPGNPAYEINTDESAKNYHGIYTQELLKALNGQIPTLFSDFKSRTSTNGTLGFMGVTSDEETYSIVPAYELSQYLSVAVPIAAENFNISITQKPDAEITSRPPNYLSIFRKTEFIDQQPLSDPAEDEIFSSNKEFNGHIFKNIGGNSAEENLGEVENGNGSSIEDVIAKYGAANKTIKGGSEEEYPRKYEIRNVFPIDDVMSEYGSNDKTFPIDGKSKNKIRNFIDRLFKRNSKYNSKTVDCDALRRFKVDQDEQQDHIDETIAPILSALNRSSKTFKTGFTVVGIPDFKLSEISGIHMFKENDAVQIGIGTEFSGNTFILGLPNGCFCPLAVLPNFIGTVVVDKGELLTVNYSPSPNNDMNLYHTNMELETRRAFIADKSKNGIFNISENFDELTQSASYLRDYKKLDPTLGLYASYAYSQAGGFQSVHSIYEFMKKEPEPVLFDVAMLDKLSSENPDKDSLAAAAPFCPMLNQGWSYLAIDPESYDPLLIELSKYRVPGLWTTFTPEGAEFIKNSFKDLLL